ncbi:MAG: zf-HC2 domain-containing protein [Pyrinomonadaceae bacterium]
MKCKDFKDIADSYLSNELLVETNHEVLQHLEACANCRSELASRRELRERLRLAVKNAPRSQMNPGFAARVKSDLHEQAFGKQRVWSFATSKAVFAGFAFMLIFAAVIGIIVTQRKMAITAKIDQPAPYLSNDPPTGLWYERASFVVVKDDAVDDHKHCAISHDLTEKPISLKEADKSLGTKANGLDLAVFDPLRTAFGDDAKFVRAHFCIVNGRRFSHVVVEYKKKTVSVLLTLREDVDPVTRDAVSCRTSDDLRVACFESGKYSVFIVSDLNDDDNLIVARTISDSVTKHVTDNFRKT